MIRAIRCLWRDRSAFAATEFALVLPLLVTLGLGAIELANMAISYMRISQIAITVADNASRAKQASTIGAPEMREYDVDEAFNQADVEYPAMRIFDRGRIILSSLETNPAPDNGQWIHWQRCRGSYVAGSRYGIEGTGSTGTSFAGMGASPDTITAAPNSAVMFVEVYYQYQPLFLDVDWARPTIYRAAAVYVRDDRDLVGPSGGDGLYNPVSTPPATVYTCN